MATSWIRKQYIEPVVGAGKYRTTFISAIDGSLQYYSVTLKATTTAFTWPKGETIDNDGKAGFISERPLLYGTFKEAFNNRMIFIYGTIGNKVENDWSFNKARYDAETRYYRGNGAVDIIAHIDYTAER